jgi:hypothetical protein
VLLRKKHDQISVDSPSTTEQNTVLWTRTLQTNEQQHHLTSWPVNTELSCWLTRMKVVRFDSSLSEAAPT